MISEVNILNKFDGKKVVVTGHTGFKGSWMSYALAWLGADVFGFSLDTPDNSDHVYHSLGVSSQVNKSSVVTGDVKLKEYSEFLQRVKPDFIFHLAAQSIVSRGLIEPIITIETNTFGILNLLEFLRVNPKNIPTVIITSDKCYKNRQQQSPYYEHDEMGGEDPYSASKAAAEILFQAYLESYFKPKGKAVATTRAGNVFGGGDWSTNRLIPDSITSVFEKNEILLRMPFATRPWTYVLDVIRGYIMLGDALSLSPTEYSGSWNFASNEKMRVIDVAQVVQNYLEPYLGSIDVRLIDNKIKEHSLLQLNSDKAKTLLRWNCRNTLKESIEETADWYFKQRNGDDMKLHSNKILDLFFKC
jgi:CDP-glucose 4,6-dehydratase